MDHGFGAAAGVRAGADLDAGEYRAVVALLGCALWQLGSPFPSPLARPARPHSAAAAGLLALLTLCEYIAGTDIGIDELVFEDPAEVAFPGRISPQTATAIVLLAVPLLLPEHALSRRSRRARSPRR